MTDLILVAVLAVIVGFAARYVYRAKKSGAKCIGCPVEGGCAGACGHNGTDTCACHSESQDQE